MIVRPMQPDDARLCARWMAQTPLWQRYGVTEPGALHRFELGLEQGALIAIAERIGQPVGFVWYTLRGAFNRSGYIPLIGVAPNEYSQGIGQALMDHAEDRVFQHVGELFLLVSDFNQAAQRFYRQRGYIQVGALPDYILPGVSELIYYKRGAAGEPPGTQPLESTGD
jgi:ribosomal protein S18 acetylase RimI-like enzyme